MGKMRFGLRELEKEGNSEYKFTFTDAAGIFNSREGILSIGKWDIKKITINKKNGETFDVLIDNFKSCEIIVKKDPSVSNMDPANEETKIFILSQLIRSNNELLIIDPDPDPGRRP